MGFNFNTFDIAKYDNILSRGLSFGLGEPEKQVCIEAAICETLGLPHGDDPQCVADSVRSFKIRLNDSDWSSPAARAQGLRDLGLAQLGSLGVVGEEEFSKRIAEKTIRVLIPKLFREVFPEDQACLAAALKCEQEGTAEAAEEARDAAPEAATAGASASWAARAASAAAAAFIAYAATAYVAYAASAARYAAKAAQYIGGTDYLARADAYLILSAQLALEVLRELNSPGVNLLNEL